MVYNLFSFSKSMNCIVGEKTKEVNPFFYAINPILLSESYTYNGANYIKRNNLGINEGTLDLNNEGKGSVYVVLRLVVPPSESDYGSFLSKIRLNATCIKEI